MAVFVVDASVSLAWCLADEATDWTVGLLARLRQADRAAVPMHWAMEVLNGLLVAVRRKRIDFADTAMLWNRLSLLPFEPETALEMGSANAVLALGEKYRLTVYDAAYLELAMRKQLSLATLDNELRRAAASEGIYFCNSAKMGLMTM